MCMTLKYFNQIVHHVLLFDLKQDDHYSLFLRTISNFLLASVPDFIPNHVKLFSVDYSQSFFFNSTNLKKRWVQYRENCVNLLHSTICIHWQKITADEQFR